MPKAVEQIFVHSTQIDRVKELLREYVDLYSNQFIQCSSVLLLGVQQVLAGLVRNRRKFNLQVTDGWTVIWEIVHRTEFADPSIVKFLSQRLNTETIWVKIDHDYNLWAFQCFRNGEAESEAFLPVSYFEGLPESEARFDYGDCGDAAEAFNAQRSLPLFLLTVAWVERMPGIHRNMETLVCKLTTN